MFLPVGVIETSHPVMLDGKTAKRVGTAFMISPCHALANYHVVFGDSKTPSREGFEVRLAIGNRVGADRHTGWMELHDDEFLDIPDMQPVTIVGMWPDHDTWLFMSRCHFHHGLGIQ